MISCRGGDYKHDKKMKRLGGDSKKSLRLKSMLGAKSGFALIATIAVMALMAITAMAMLGLSTVEVRSSSHGDAMEEAKANARMALMIAIGELQKTAGPDQRVTATGNLDDQVAAGKHNWTGVWSSEQGSSYDEVSGEFLGWLVSDPNALSGIVDYSVITENESVGSQSDFIEIVSSGTVDLSDNPTIGKNADSNTVIAGKIPVSSGSQQIVNGHYAWWVGDEGVKARVDLQNKQEENALAAGGTQRSAVEVIGAVSGTSVRDGFQDIDPESDDLTKFITVGSVGNSSGADNDLVRTYYHDITTHSQALMTNNRDGGLKVDLSQLFEKSDSNFEALDPETYANYEDGKYSTYSRTYSGGSGALLYSKPGVTSSHSEEGRLYGPTLDILRDYYRLYKSVANKDSKPSIQARASYPNRSQTGSWIESASALQWRWFGWNEDYHLFNKSAWANNSGSLTVPRITRANYTPYLNRVISMIGIRSVPKGDIYELELLFQPMLFVHNPYNVEMSMDGLRYLADLASDGKIMLNVKSAPLNKWCTERFDMARIMPEDAFYAGEFGNAESVGKAKTVCYELSSKQSFAPGEIRVFVPEGAERWNGGLLKMVPLGNNYDPENMAVVLDSESSNLNNVVLSWLKGKVAEEYGDEEAEKYMGLAAADRMKAVVAWSGYYRNSFEMPAASGGGYDAIWSGISYWLGQVSTGHVSDYGGGQHGAVEPIIVSNVSALQNTKPVFFSDIYVRPLESEVISITGKSDKISGFPSFIINNPVASTDANRNSFNRVRSGASAYSPMWHSHLDVPQSYNDYLAGKDFDGNGVWGTSNEGNAGKQQTVMLQVPVAPLISLGAFQHANINLRGSEPALAIGNSFPNLAMQSASELVETGMDGASGRGAYLEYDSCYLANEALWDKYFLSSISPRPSDSAYNNPDSDAESSMDNVISDFVSGVEPLANSRMSFIDAGLTSSEILSTLSDYELAASQLAVKGGFNINSTSEQAWKALLSGFRSQAIEYFDGSSVRTETGGQNDNPLMRMSLSAGGGVNAPRAKDDSAWAGYLQLTNTQIDQLAQEIVKENKDRAKERSKQVVNNNSTVVPCLTLGQFVNRMPESNNSDYQYSGPLQAAINAAGINSSMESGESTFTIGDYNKQPWLTAGSVKDSLFPNTFSKFELPQPSMSPTYLMQGDVLQAIGSSISARSDTFVVRAYGESLDSSGKIVAQAWCEAVVQRVPQPVLADASEKWEPELDSDGKGTARKFAIKQFRWLSKDEV